MEEAHTGRQPAPKPCSLPHQCLGLRPTFLHPTFLLLPDESTGGAAPAAGSLRVPHLPAGSIIVGLQQWPAPPLGLGRDARGGAGQRTDGGRELPSLVDSKTVGRLQCPSAPTACWISLTGVQQLRAAVVVPLHIGIARNHQCSGWGKNERMGKNMRLCTKI